MVNDHNIPNIVIMGDFNENQLSKSKHPITQTCAIYGFQQVCKEPTTTNGSLLDLVFVKLKDYKEQVKILKTYYSDHEMVVLHLNQCE